MVTFAGVVREHNLGRKVDYLEYEAYPEMAVAPDWGLGILFGLGGMVGMYLGARCQKYVPARAIKWMLVVVLLFTGIKYVIG